MQRAIVTVALLAALALPHHATADADALWHIVGGECVPDEQQNHSPKPCEQVDLAAGWAVLKDRDGDTQFLLIPTARVSGIESPELLAPNAPNYFAAAWDARHFVDQRAHRDLPRDVLGLAINSVSGRTQDQLHIHIDCTRLDVVAAVHEHSAAIGPQWAPFPAPLAGHDYVAMRLDNPELGNTNPFDLLANGVAGARGDMAHYTLVLLGTGTGFVLLASHADIKTGNRGSGEELQDHACAAAH